MSNLCGCRFRLESRKVELNKLLATTQEAYQAEISALQETLAKERKKVHNLNKQVCDIKYI